MYSDDGVFVANTNLPGSQEDPGLAQLANGNVVVAWKNHLGSTYSIRAQIVTPEGDKVGLEFQVNSAATQGGGDPVVLVLPSGNFVVAWTAYPQHGSNGGEVRAQMFTAAGVPVGSEIAVNSTTDGHQSMRDMAALADGGFVIVYENSHWQLQQDTVIARMFDLAGRPGARIWSCRPLRISRGARITASISRTPMSSALPAAASSFRGGSTISLPTPADLAAPPTKAISRRGSTATTPTACRPAPNS